MKNFKVNEIEIVKRWFGCYEMPVDIFLSKFLKNQNYSYTDKKSKKLNYEKLHKIFNFFLPLVKKEWEVELSDDDFIDDLW